MEKHITAGKSTITALVISSLQSALSEGDKPPIDPMDESTCLIGRQSVLDSLGLVTLLVDLEQRLDEEYGLSLTLADERAMSRKQSPFRTVQALADYICLLIEEAPQHDGT
jgi:acyl carrier protein